MATQQKSTQPKPSLEKFVDQLIEEKKFPQMTDDIRTQIKKDLHQRLNDYINAKLITQLSDEQANKLNELLKKDPKTEEVNKFFETNIPDLVTVMANILFDFRKRYLGLM